VFQFEASLNISFYCGTNGKLGFLFGSHIWIVAEVFTSESKRTEALYAHRPP
jgi:hypothetical protein